MSKEQFKGPTWRYDPKTGEGRVFTDVNAVPAGWVDSLDGSDDAQSGVPADLDGMSRKDITDALKVGGIKFAAKASDAELYDLLRNGVLKALVQNKIEHDDNAKLPDLLALLS